MSLWSWVRALTEAKEKGMGHAPIACEWDHPSSKWARRWGPYNKTVMVYFGMLQPVCKMNCKYVSLTIKSYMVTMKCKQRTVIENICGNNFILKTNFRCIKT